ncbi:MAG TPA: extracellular solute-binding protein, partial [Massilibacterium sp.]|nr:extracellular solute-binding protein [Massilibacterium sp.]
ENEKLDYVVPKEGSNLWFDNIVIPKSAKNVEGAHQFINFLLDPKNAAQNAEYIGYSTPNEKALEYMDKKIAEDERFYPDEEVTEKLEVYENLGKQNLAIYNDLFLEFKMYKK